MVTIKNLAEILDLNISTVSRALNNDVRVKDSTKQKVNDLAKKMGYRPNLAARSLVQGKTKTIWFIVPVISDPVEIQTPQFASQYLSKEDYDLVVAIHHNDPVIYERLLNRLKQGVADGALILSAYQEQKDPIVDELIEENYPIVFLDRYNETLQTSIVTTDNEECGRELVKLCRDEGSEYFFPLFSKKYINIVEEKRLAGVVNQLNKDKLKYTLDFNSLSEEEKTNLPENLTFMASTQEVILNFVNGHQKYFANKKITFAGFDVWEGEPSPARKAFICVQNLQEVSEIGVRKLIEKIDKKTPNKQEIITVPAREYIVINNHY